MSISNVNETNERINELCAAIVKENNPAAFLKLTAELNQILAQKFEAAASRSNSSSKSSD